MSRVGLVSAPSTRLTNSMQSIWKRADLNGLRVRVRVGAGLLWLYLL